MGGRLHLTIVGVGALGCLFGSYLSRASALGSPAPWRASRLQVRLIGNWAAQLETLQARGITLLCPDGRRIQHPLCATNDPSRVSGADVVLVLVKSGQTQRAAQLIARMVHAESVVISLQNGLGNRSILADAVGESRVASGVTFQGAYWLAPGILRHAASGPTHLGVIPGLEERLEGVAGLLSQSGLETAVVDNIDGLVWGKLAVNAAINPLTAMLNVANGQLLATAARQRLVAAAACEVARVAAAQGIVLPYVDAAERAFEVCRATAHNRSSMWQDLQRGAPTEIDAICGAVVRLGRRLGIATPVNNALLTWVKAKERGQEVALSALPEVFHTLE